ncbi:hypothetical protein PSACC_03564 [Paramicrosporidium saccamoebae]|uniref:Uncharacterized protein n=1 Tax=Paramicrosporidium saccamoebae TaxID=1246581 RepID=A0A2H9TFN7_9FUNG|nr:hypothetical protein PSACC_03564 [Paramicrosporidium saccamoebae]
MEVIFKSISFSLPNAMKVAEMFRSPLYEYAIHYDGIGETKECIDQLVELAKEKELNAALLSVSKLVADPRLARRILAENIPLETCLVCIESEIGGLRLRMTDEWVQESLMLLATKQLSRMDSLCWLRQYLEHATKAKISRLAELLVPNMTPDIIALLLPKTNAVFLENYLSTDVLCRLLIVSLAKMTCQASLTPLQESIIYARWQDFSLETVRIHEESHSGDVFTSFKDHHLSDSEPAADPQLFVKVFGLLANIGKDRSDLSFWAILAKLLLHCDGVVDQGVCMERTAWYLETVDFSIVPPSVIRELIFRHVPRWDDSYFKKTLERIPTSHIPNRLLLPQTALQRWVRYPPFIMLPQKHDRDLKTWEKVASLIVGRRVLPLNVWVCGQWIGDALIRRAESTVQSIEGMLMAWPYLLLTGRKMAMGALFEDTDQNWQMFIRRVNVLANRNQRMMLEAFYIPRFFTIETLRMLIDSTFKQ